MIGMVGYQEIFNARDYTNKVVKCVKEAGQENDKSKSFFCIMYTFVP